MYGDTENSPIFLYLSLKQFDKYFCSGFAHNPRIRIAQKAMDMKGIKYMKGNVLCASPWICGSIC